MTSGWASLFKTDFVGTLDVDRSRRRQMGTGTRAGRKQTKPG